MDKLDLDGTISLRGAFTMFLDNMTYIVLLLDIIIIALVVVVIVLLKKILKSKN